MKLQKYSELIIFWQYRFNFGYNIFKRDKIFTKMSQRTSLPWPEWLTGVAIPFEVGGRAVFRLGCKVGWVRANGAWGQRFS